MTDAKDGSPSPEPAKPKKRRRRRAKDGERVREPGIYIDGPVAAALGWVPFALVDAFMIASLTTSDMPFYRRVELQLFDLRAACAAALLSALAVLAVSAAEKRWWPRLGRTASLVVDYGMVACASIAAGALFVHHDFDGLAMRKAPAMHVTMLHYRAGATLLLSLALALALPIGRLFARPKVRVLAIAASFVVAAANFRWLRNDYWNFHFCAAWATAVFSGAVLVGARVPSIVEARIRRLPAIAAKIAMAIPAALALSFVLVPPSPGLAARVMLTGGTPYTRPLVFFGYRGHHDVPELRPEEKPWFSPRKGLPPIPSTAKQEDADQAIVLLLTIDAFRADSLDSGQYDAYMPTLAKLREESVHFTQAHSPGSQTTNTMSSWFSGKYFSQLYWIGSANSINPWLKEDKSVRFPSLLGKKGIGSVDVMGANWLSPENGIVGGFSKYINLRLHKSSDDYARAREIGDKIVGLLEEQDSAPLFVFAHFLDAHAPYDRGGKQGTPRERQHREVTLVDTQIARILATLDSLGLRERTTIILSADHGEAFGEHGATQHGVSVYEELIHVPLLINSTSFPARRIDDLVTTMDFGPTILDLFGVDTPAVMMGESLVPALRGGSVPEGRPIVSENRLRQTMVFPNGIKVTRDLEFGGAEVYDLNTDPGELHNRIDDPTLDAKNEFAKLNAFFDVQTLRKGNYKPPYRK